MRERGIHIPILIREKLMLFQNRGSGGGEGLCYGHHQVEVTPLELPFSCLGEKSECVALLYALFSFLLL